MKSGDRWPIAGLLALPLALLIADVTVRLRVIRAFSVVEWSCYLTSVVLMIGVYCGVVGWLRRLGGRWPGWLARVAVAMGVRGPCGPGYGR